MKNPRRLAGIGVAVLLLGGAAVWFWPDIVPGLHNAAGEHVFDGKTSSRWRADLRAELTDFNKLAQPVSRALKDGESAEAVPVLIDLLDDEDVQVRRVATMFLRDHFTRKTGPEATAGVGPLTACLRDNDPMVRRRAVEALGYLGPDAREAVPAIAGLLKDPDEDIVVEAAYALGTMGPEGRAALPAVREACKDPRPRVQKNAALALEKIDPGKRNRTP